MNKHSHLIKCHDGCNEKLHLEKSSNGTKEWWLDGARHREDGPAIEWSDGSKYWYQHGQLHREEGPAVIIANGQQEWWLHGLEYSEEEFKQWLAKKNLNEKLQATFPHKPITRRGKI